jgi:putative ABC transport system permease protein
VKDEETGSREGRDMFFLGVDGQFLKTYEIQLIKGRNFIPGTGADSSAVIINETAAKELKITEPSGQLIEIPSAGFDGSFSSLDKPFTARVVGIVKDFNFESLREPVGPMVLGSPKNPVQSIDYFTARMSPGDAGESLKQMDAILHSIDANHLLEYHFLDKQWELFYRADKIRETIFLIMAILAIAIACLGLFGLTTYAAEQRIKEVGIRKVLGANVGSILSLLSKDFIKLVIIAAIIAIPIAWYFMNKWLQEFAYRISIGWWIFAVAGIVALLIAVFTVSFQAIKAAIANPVTSLRSE